MNLINIDQKKLTPVKIVTYILNMAETSDSSVVENVSSDSEGPIEPELSPNYGLKLKFTIETYAEVQIYIQEIVIFFFMQPLLVYTWYFKNF